MRRLTYLCFYLLLNSPAFSAEHVLNVYAWGSEIPKALISQFEKETNIKVNFSTYDSNETMYAKLRASQNTIYDIVLPSAYFVERMRDQGMLARLDHHKLPNIVNIAPMFTQNEYDVGNQFSIPLVWGVTGIVYNQTWIKSPPRRWSDLWKTTWRNQLLLLDDSREVFSIALMSLGFAPNDQDPSHIHRAFQALKKLTPNIKLFSSEGIQAILIDGDATIGAAWNGDALKAHAENHQINFIYPEDGFLIWVDCVSILRDAPHKEEAYTFLNFLLKAQSAASIATLEGHAITNAAGIRLLPKNTRENPTVYPSSDTLKRGFVQRDVNEATLALYNQLWEQFKLGF